MLCRVATPLPQPKLQLLKGIAFALIQAIIVKRILDCHLEISKPLARVQREEAPTLVER